ncbi:ACT domain-containing protein [Eubacteriales bacterium OttesenSCG-928-N13]|nr:ACT domain-containing protein [Eubacteriales bacterium OttesenSCG-928-N13]
MDKQKKAVVTVLGFDRKGIIAQVSRVLYESDVNILDISQTIVSGLFNMVMLVDITSPSCGFEELAHELDSLGERLGVQIRIQRHEIFEAMYQV